MGLFEDGFCLPKNDHFSKDDLINHWIIWII